MTGETVTALEPAIRKSDHADQRCAETGLICRMAREITAEARCASQRSRGLIEESRRAILVSRESAIDSRRVAWELRSALRKHSPQLPPLSETEWEVAGFAALSWSDAEIAERLPLSQATVKFHLFHAFAKLRITRRSQLTRILDSVL